MSPEITDSHPPALQQKLAWSEHLVVILASIGILSVFGLAVWLVPDPRGYGTHQQLGLPECTLRRLTGYGCPHCGMTTSFCWFVRGEWGQAFRCSPAGVLLAVMCVCLWPWCVLVSFKRVWLGTQEPGRFVLIGLVGWLLLSLIMWIARLN